MNLEQEYKLKTNPFRMTPALNPDELVWAGFKDIKSKIEKRILKNIKIPNSTLVLNWGEYGSGKTHAARYFSKSDVLDLIASKAQKSSPLSFVISLPKGKDPVYNIFISIIDKLDLRDLQNKSQSRITSIKKFIDEFDNNRQIQNVLKAIFSSDEEDIQLLMKYLYGNLTNTELKKLSKYDILRPLNSESDFTKVLAGLFSALTFQKEMYSCVVIWIDEFEDIGILNNTNIEKTNNFLREILDNTPNNLLLFLNLTQTALVQLEDLGEYLFGSVRSRIKERNNFSLPSASEFREYLTDILRFFRTEDFKETEDNKYHPFKSDLVEVFLNELENSSLRQFNEAFSMLIELAELEDQSIIDIDFFEDNKSEVIGWKEE